MIKILIADDHEIVRRGLKQMIEEQRGMKIVGEAETAQQALDLAQKHDCDVAVLDISMPGRSAIETMKEMRQLKPRLQIIFLSAHPEEQYAVRVLKAGAAGYVNKMSASEEIIKAIKKAYDGGRYVSSALAEKLAFNLAVEADTPLHESLSDRELQVLLLIGAGRQPSEIAEELSLSVSTVSAYRSRILEKMKMKTTAELMRYVIENNLLD